MSDPVSLHLSSIWGFTFILAMLVDVQWYLIAV